MLIDSKSVERMLDVGYHRLMRLKQHPKFPENRKNGKKDLYDQDEMIAFCLGVDYEAWLDATREKPLSHESESPYNRMAKKFITRREPNDETATL